jgi:hypothetical protein
LRPPPSFSGHGGPHLTRGTWFDGLCLEVAKAGFEVVAVGVLGGPPAAVRRNVAAQREIKARDSAEKRERHIDRKDRIRCSS